MLSRRVRRFLARLTVWLVGLAAVAVSAGVIYLGST